MKGINSTHGKSKTAEYFVWRTMKARCHNPNSSSYSKYGAKGITVCDRWRNSFENFISDIGYRPSENHSIERKDNCGNYEPSNCKWATAIEQANNTSSNRFIEHDGRKKTLAEWSRESGVDADIIALRIDRWKWDLHEAIFTKERRAASGLKGLYWQKSRRQWNVRFTQGRKLFDLGRFDNILDAASALLGNRAVESLLTSFERDD